MGFSRANGIDNAISLAIAYILYIYAIGQGLVGGEDVRFLLLLLLLALLLFEDVRGVRRVR